MAAGYPIPLPSVAPPGDFERVRQLVQAGSTRLVVLDDDPTGTQTVHGIDVLAEWSVQALEGALASPQPCVYVLTNSRSLPAAEASELARTIAGNLREASRRTGVPVCVVSRSDSTLRGHFQEEVAALEQTLGPVDATLVIPAFFEGGRTTVGDVHYVAEGDRQVPAAETEFAKDKVFGYTQSNLRAWIEEKTHAAVPADQVASFGLATLRSGDGAAAVQAQLLGLPRGAHAIVNAAAYRDLEVFVHGLLRAEAQGKRYLFRTAASFVRVRAGIEPKPVMAASEIADPGIGGGLVIVGSYVGKTTAQLEELLRLATVRAVEFQVERLASGSDRADEVARVAARALAAMQEGLHAVVYTSRGPRSSIGAVGDLRAGRLVSDALVEVVRAIGHRPRILVAKGGITSCDIAVLGLGMRRARVLGQAAPGVPVWQMGAETLFPGLRYVVWPGNVGAADSLARFMSGA